MAGLVRQSRALASCVILPASLTSEQPPRHRPDGVGEAGFHVPLIRFAQTVGPHFPPEGWRDATLLGKQSLELPSVRDLAATHTTGFGFGTSPQELETGTLDALHSALATLQAKAPDETSAYSAFVLDVAESVANAVSGVSAPESAAIEKIKGALQTV